MLELAGWLTGRTVEGMGAKQSSPAATGRMRAYSGSDLPSSTSTSNGNSRTAAVGVRYAYGGTAHGASGASGASHHISSRARSVGGSGGGSGARPQSSINIPTSGAYSSQESGSSTPEESGGDRDRSGAGHGGPRLLIGSLPAHLSPHLFGGKGTLGCSATHIAYSPRYLEMHFEDEGAFEETVMTGSPFGNDSLLGGCQLLLEQWQQGATAAGLDSVVRRSPGDLAKQPQQFLRGDDMSFCH